ncbi:MAG TPA: hypothetical protein GX524_05290, partial [Firmicutes bacterium]|nr:hypothetical protein [Bacillota bacterium]
MEQPKVTAVVFEGGQAKTSLEEVIKDIRKQVVVDTLSKLVMAPEIDQVLLVTNYEDLASEVSDYAMVDFEPNRRKFHFGARLRQVIVNYGLENVIYMGGAAA